MRIVGFMVDSYMAVARLMERVVTPTPPFGLKTVMIRPTCSSGDVFNNQSRPSFCKAKERSVSETGLKRYSVAPARMTLSIVSDDLSELVAKMDIWGNRLSIWEILSVQ